MKTFLVIAFMALSNISFAGSSDAKIAGMTSSSRTQVELFVSDITGDVRKVTLTVAGESYSFPPSDSIVIQDKKTVSIFY